MTDTSTTSPSALLETVESLPFPERLIYVAGVSASQRRALRGHLDHLTSALPPAAEGSKYQSERLAIMMGLDGLERMDPGTGGPPGVQAKRGTNKVAVGTLTVGVVAAFIAVSANSRSNTAANDRRPSAPTPRGPTTAGNPSATPPPPQLKLSDVLSGSASWLQSEIDAGRTELRSLESRLRTMKSDLDFIESQLSSYKAEIEREESNTRLGLYVNEYGYRAALDNYNELVPQYNLQLQTYNSRYAEYQRVRNRTNELIDQYNARLRR